MNIYYFDPSLNCSLFFISLSLYPITLYLSLAFSIFTHYPLTHFLILPRSSLFPPACLFHLLILPSISFHSLCNIFPPLSSYTPLPSPSPLCITATVKTRQSSSKLELGCLYSEKSQVKSVTWKHQNKSRRLRLESNGPGSITTVLPLPITSDTAGNYTCILQLKNGQTVWATQAVALPQGMV